MSSEAIKIASIRWRGHEKATILGGSPLNRDFANPINPAEGSPTRTENATHDQTTVSVMAQLNDFPQPVIPRMNRISKKRQREAYRRSRS
jgi:hypothetical protein